MPKGIYKRTKKPYWLGKKRPKMQNNTFGFQKGHIPWNKNIEHKTIQGDNHWSQKKKYKKSLDIIIKQCKKNSIKRKGKSYQEIYGVNARIEKKKRADSHRGAKSHLWKGGKSFQSYGIEFNKKLKNTIRIRDEYKCQMCFIHQDVLYDSKGRYYKLIIHHIDENKKNNSLDNLRALCRNCHIELHNKINNG